MPLPSPPLRSDAEALVSGLAQRATQIAALIQPPFTSARKRKIELAFSDAAQEFGTLSRLVMQSRQATSLHDPAHHAYLSGLSNQLAFWNQARVVARAIKPVRPPASNPETQPLLAAYDQCFVRLHRHFLDKAAELAPPDWPTSSHRDIALPFTRFLIYAALARRTARALGKAGALHFVDVGCGVGLKLLQAGRYFERVSGIEYEPHRAEAAADWLGRSAEVITADAVTYPSYGDFDVIYAYKPVQDDALMRQTEDRMVAMARPGTVLIMPYMDFHQRHEDLGCQQIEDAVYVAKASALEVARAKALLPHIGEVLPEIDPKPEGFATPIRDALRRWGHLG